MVDLQNLNAPTRWVMRLTFSLNSTVLPGKKKTVLGAWNGCHSILLSEEIHNSITFITEWGRYRYLQAPQGFQASNNGYTKLFDDFTGFPDLAYCVDDVALSLWHTVRYIKL